jgi:SEC-C motif-containing protein
MMAFAYSLYDAKADPNCHQSPEIPMTKLPKNTPCPCGTQTSYEECCGKYHSGQASAETAEKLMRSRYSAFVVGDGDYLKATIAAEYRAGFDVSSIYTDETQWVGLEIVDKVAGDILDNSGQVEFIARFIENGRNGQLHERSNFSRREGKWFYVDGEFMTTKPSQNSSGPGTDKVGRNDPCHCGSGKKYKKCCG